MEKNVELWEKKFENQIFKKSNEKKLYFRLCQPWGIHIANMSKELYYVDEPEIRKKFLLLKSKKKFKLVSLDIKDLR